MTKKSKIHEPKPTRDEIRASEIVVADLGGSTDPLDRPGLRSFADFRPNLPGRPPGVLEITAHGDPVRGSLGAAMRRRQHDFRRPELTKFWALYLPSLASEFHLPYSQVVKRLDEIAMVLRVLESQNRSHFRAADADRSVEASALRDLGVDHGMASSTGQPGVFFLEPSSSGFSGPSAVAAAALSEALKDDNLTKLRKGTGDGTADSRHLFVWILATQAVPYFALLDDALPTEPAAIPDPVTDLWIGGVYRSGEVVWHIDGSSWRRVTTDRRIASADA